MPDGAPSAVGRDAADERALAADGRLVRRVRWRLAAWSGGTTLLVLAVLSIALYFSAARTLEASGTSLLVARVDDIHDILDNPRGRPGPDFGFKFGGGSSGTFAMLLNQNGVGVRGSPVPPDGLPDQDSLAAARQGVRDVRTTQVGPVPVRVLTEPITILGRSLYLQVVGDRTAEQQTLDAILRVLVVGGGIVVLVAVAFGWIYARRALVPIRDSLASQRAALRRQREFAADASHELRTPLTVIRSSVDHLRRHRSEPVDAVVEAVDDIDAEVEHLTALVDDLLLLARSDSGAITLERQPVDVGGVAADAASALAKPAASKEVRLLIDPEPAPVVGDPARLGQLVRILVDNAIRHSPRGGDVRVRVRTDGRTATIVVEDDGPGIPAAEMPHVFERFWRSPAAPKGGTGLGLAIAASIVELHAGRIGVSNGPSGGAWFVVHLPAAEPPAPTGAGAGLRVPADRPS